MSKHFKPIELEKEVVLNKPKKELLFPKAQEFDGAVQKFRIELEKLHNGTSEFSKHAIEFSKGICLSSIELNRFYKFPSEKALKSFLLCCSEEINIRFAQAVSEWFSINYPKAKELI